MSKNFLGLTKLSVLNIIANNGKSLQSFSVNLSYQNQQLYNKSEGKIRHFVYNINSHY